tara:strand:+ start:1178 stop:1579 length:402 start_codon:yes stop_codon:yes gene_type:complete
MPSNVSTQGWSSSRFETALESRSYRLIFVQAAAFSLFMIMSDAWTTFFEAIVEAAMPAKTGMWLSLVRAVASTVFCCLIVTFIIFVMGLKFNVDDGTMCVFGKKYRVARGKKKSVVRSTLSPRRRKHALVLSA